MVHKAAEKCQKKVLSSIFSKKHLFWKTGREGGVFDSALVPLQDGQLAVDLAIWPLPRIIVRIWASYCELVFPSLPTRLS